MTQTLSRMYKSQAEASRAQDELKKYNYQHIYLVTRPDGHEDEEHTHNAIVRALTGAYIWQPHAEVYAKGINKGGALVTVHAPFGTALRASKIMDRHGPIESGVAEHREPSCAWDEATPMSSALQMPTLIKTKTPFSVIWNLVPVLTKAPKVTEALMPTLAKEKAPLSRAVGMPLLSSGRTPFSSQFGLPLLSKGR